ncbi:MAG: YabP/YqfC family sporulation protein [Clostridia bacterium]|nr:YabP/YqfC family sporulation protein [Clostridia bacterium]
MSQITQPSTTKPQKSLNIVFDSAIEINGLTEMLESDEKQVICNLGDRSLIITGEKLKIVNLDTTRGICSLSGSIASLKYSKGKQKLSFFKKIFK